MSSGSPGFEIEIYFSFRTGISLVDDFLDIECPESKSGCTIR